MGRRFAGLLVLGCTLALSLALGLTSVSAGRSPHAQNTSCGIPNDPNPRDPANPLDLPTKPTSGDPLQGAHFFVDGPKHGQAAGAVAHAIGLNPKSFSDTDGWGQFKADHLAQINANPTAKALAKIADQEETQNVSEFAMGGGRGAIYAQTRKLLCTNASADQGGLTNGQRQHGTLCAVGCPNQGLSNHDIMVLSSFFVYPNGEYCPDEAALEEWGAKFREYVDETAEAIGDKPAVIAEEIDSIGASDCTEFQGGRQAHAAAAKNKALSLWLADLSYESKKLSKLPHTVVYAEAGYSDAQTPMWTAKRLWQAGISQDRGFYTNDTHFAWSIDEIRWAEAVSDDLFKLSHGQYRAHFVVNTAQNGEGPKLNPHPVSQGIENLCNPPGRGLGRTPTGDVNPTFDGLHFKYLDGFLWTGVPGRSHNSNCPNGPWNKAGTFDPRFALELADHANQKLGKGYHSRPY